jgi:N-acetylglucosaminyldiphosphoundecaprenol N-acetyl-beta-D-mannosaminyltransferase
MITDYILGVKVNLDLSMEEVVTRVAGMLNDANTHYVSTTNAEFIMEATKDPEFKKIINAADLSIPDGAGVLYASSYLRGVARLKKGFLFPAKAFLYGVWCGLTSFDSTKVGEKVSGVDLVYRVCEYASKNDKNVFLLGGWNKDWFGRSSKEDKEVASKAAAHLKKLYPNLKIIGATSKYTRLSKDDAPSVSFIKDCMRKENVSHIDFLFVAYGHPWQEKWIVRNSHKIPAKVSFGVGGTFDYVSQFKRRSPFLFIRMNLEWLYRIIAQPWRIKRIFTAFPLFPLHIYIESLKSLRQ